VDPDDDPPNRLVNLLAHRRAGWLAARSNELILDPEPAEPEDRQNP
jgi:hypothetical protein